MLKIGPFQQKFQLLFWTSVIEPELTLFQEQVKVFSWNAIVFTQHPLGLIPKILNAIDVISALGNMRTVIDAMMHKLAHIQCPIAVIRNWCKQHCPA